MDTPDIIYDCAIIGGGLAGLSLGILMAEQGWKTVLFEKNEYPFHRVCGEYISLESKPFLERLGLTIAEEQFPHLRRLQVSAPNGNYLERPLGLGGFGISRYTIDYELSKIAIQKGVVIVHGKVDNVEWEHDIFYLRAGKESYAARLCNGSFGKRSNLDVKWQRPFIRSKSRGLNNYLGIKYHIRIGHPQQLIALHNFKNGYCGISAIEDGKYCLCYLTSASNLADYEHDIGNMEKNVLQKNRFLKRIFNEAEFLYDGPLVISQVSFAAKEQVIRQIPLGGDAAGLITPLCGNGMSMALRASHMLAPLFSQFLNEKISMTELQRSYQNQWQQEFSKRLRTGRIVQNLFGNNILTNLLIGTCKLFPMLTDSLIRSTHGDPF